MKELLIIGNDQFGYHTDSFKYCEYLRTKYAISYLCFDKGFEKKSLKSVSVIYIPRTGTKLFRSLHFVKRALIEIYRTKGLIFLIYWKFFFLFPILFPWKKMILDIRTLSVDSDANKRYQADKLLRKSTFFFIHITVVSEGVRRKLKLPESKSSVLHLGADPLSHKMKKYDAIRLLYVGTLNGRRLLDTLKGLLFFLNKYTNYNITYDIVGDGEEYEEIRNYIQQNDLGNKVFLHGYQSHDRILHLFDSCNIGVAYVPIEEYYQDQPVTKVYEYAMSGLFTIATNTRSNQEIIDDRNGILIDDTPVAFGLALEKIVSRLNKMDFNLISESLKQYTWENIVESDLCPVLDRLYR